MEQYSAKELQNYSKKQLSVLFNSQGFSKNGDYYVKEYHEGVSGCIGIAFSSLGLYHTQFITIDLGFGHAELSQLIYRLSEQKASRKILCTGWRVLSCIIDGAKYSDYEFEVKTPTEIDAVVKTVSGILERIIEPYFLENCCMSQFKYNVLHGGYCSYGSKIMVIPALYYLTGEKDKGASYIEEQLKKNYVEISLNPQNGVFIKNYQQLLANS